MHVARITSVVKRYRLGGRTVEALRGVDLEIDGSGFYGIMGPSGSGKSTLLHLMAARDRPDAGTIEILGERIDVLDERSLTRFRRRRIGLVFQQFNLIPTLDALGNVTLPALLDGMDRRDRERRGWELLESLGLGDRAHHRPEAMSGGEQQRVAVARALMFEPALLFADEPTGNLDSNTGRELLERLGSLVRDKGMSVIMVTHEPSAAVHCRRVFRLHDGRIDGSFEVEGLNAAELATRAQ